MKRFLLFVLLLIAGVGVLFLLAGENPFSAGTPDTDVLPPQPPPLEHGAKVSMEGLSLTSYRVAVDAEGVATRAPVYQFQSRSFAETVGGVYRLEKVTLTVFQEDKPGEASMILHAQRGTVPLSGPLENLQLVEDQPVDLEEVVAEIFDSKKEFPPLRVETENAQGVLAEKKFWTKAPAKLQQADSSDFVATGVGLEGDARAGKVTLLRDVTVQYLQRDEITKAPKLRGQIRCDGPLRIEPLPEEETSARRGRRLALAEGNSVLEIENLQTHSKQIVRAQTLRARIHSPREEGAEQTETSSPLSFERLDAIGSVWIDSDQLTILGDHAISEQKDGVSLTRIEGSPRALFSAGYAKSLGAQESANPIYVRCDEAIVLEEENQSAGSLRLRFEKNVCLFGGSNKAWIPNRFGSHLELVLEKSPTANSESAPKLQSGHAEGGVFWSEGQNSVLASCLEINPNPDSKKPPQITFSPAPILKSSFSGDLISSSAEKGPQKEIWLSAEKKLVQLPSEKPGQAGSILLEGEVVGSVRNPDGLTGALRSRGLRLIPDESGAMRAFAEHGFFYDEGEEGQRIIADRLLPSKDGAIQLEGSPAQLRRFLGKGKFFSLKAKNSAFDPQSGYLKAEGSVSLIVPSSSTALLPTTSTSSSEENMELDCDFLEGKQSASGDSFEWLKANGSVRIRSGAQQAQGSALHADFQNSLHRLFGPQENPAWISGPMEKGSFLAKSIRIDILDSGNRIVLAPGKSSAVELRGEAVDLGALPTGGAQGGIRAIPSGESELSSKQISFRGGVVLESLATEEKNRWTLFSEDLDLERNPQSGSFEKLEAQKNVQFASFDRRARSETLFFWPEKSELLLLGSAQEPALLETIQGVKWRSETLHYNLQTHLLRSSAQSSIRPQ